MSVTAPRTRGGAFSAPLATLGALLVTAAVLDYFGVAGFRAGWALCLVVLGVVTVTTIVLTLPKDSPWQGAWVLTALVLSVTAAAWLTPRAPLSKGRLDAQLDALTLPLWRTTAQEAGGNSRCSSSCPRVAHLYRAPDTSPTGALLLVAAALSHHELVPDLKALATSRPKQSMTVFTDREDIHVTATPRPGHLEVRIEARATPERRSRIPRFRSA